MSVFRTASSAAAKRLGWPGSRRRRPSLLGWPGAVERPASSGDQAEAVSRETEAQTAEVVSRETTEDDGAEGDSADDLEPAREELVTLQSARVESEAEVSPAPGTHAETVADEVLAGEPQPPVGPSPTEPAAVEQLSGMREGSGHTELTSTESGTSNPVSARTASAPAPSTTVRAPGPRRAKFDRDEFDNDPTPDEPSVTKAERGQSGAGFPAPTQTRIFVVANQKGGVGKTTTSVNLAAALALGGLDVLVLDLDPQGNASTALGIDHGPGVPGTYEVLIEGAAIEDHLVASPEAPHLQVLPATIDLAGAEIQLVSSVARENRLRKALRTYLADHPVDYVFLDCPPSLGLITLNALVAASEILIPIQCEYYALEGVSQLVRTINLVKGELNEGLEVSTVLLTMYDARTRLAAQVAEEVRSYFAEQTLPTVIPRSVRISEAPSYGQTVLTYHPDSAGAVSYLEAAQEIARRGAGQDRQ